MGTMSFPGVNCGRGVLLTTHPLLVSQSWKSTARPLPTIWATPACNGITLPFYFQTRRFVTSFKFQNILVTIFAFGFLCKVFTLCPRSAYGLHLVRMEIICIHQVPSVSFIRVRVFTKSHRSPLPVCMSAWSKSAQIGVNFLKEFMLNVLITVFIENVSFGNRTIIQGNFHGNIDTVRDYIFSD
jgi:hypothetical protein